MSQPVIIPTTMRDSGDCAVCCLVMLTGRSYGAVVNATAPRSAVTVKGMSEWQIIAAAKRLGVVLKRVKEPEEDDIGILSLERLSGADAHAVVYVRDTIFNPRDGEWWTDLAAFLKDRNWIVSGFLRRVP